MVLRSDVPLSSTGSHQVRFPCFTGTMRTLRRLAARLASLRCLRSAIPFIACVHILRSRKHPDASARGPGVSYSGNPFRLLKAWRQRDLPGSWMTPPTSALLTDPGRADVPGHTAHRYCPRYCYDEGLGDVTIEAQSHGFCGRLLRFVPGSPQGYARMASGCRPALPGGCVFPLGHARRFQSAIALFLLLQAYPGAKLLSFMIIDEAASLLQHSLRVLQSFFRLETANAFRPATPGCPAGSEEPPGLYFD